MKTQRILSIIALAAIGLLCHVTGSQAKQIQSSKSGNAGKPPAPSNAKTPTTESNSNPLWHSDPMLSSQLQSASSVGDYSLQPPLHYISVQLQENETAAYGWHGPSHPNGLMPFFMVSKTVITPRAQSFTSEDPEIALRILLAAKQRSEKTKQPDVIFSAPEFGVSNGLSFVRAYWKGHNAQNIMLHGIYYATIDGNNLYLIEGEDSEPYNKTSLPIMEAAALTFHKN